MVPSNLIGIITMIQGELLWFLMKSDSLDRLDRGALACAVASAYCAEFNVSSLPVYEP